MQGLKKTVPQTKLNKSQKPKNKPTAPTQHLRTHGDTRKKPLHNQQIKLMSAQTLKQTINDDNNGKE